MSIPSSVLAYSTLSWSPTLASDRRLPSSSPFGWRAPALRQVQVPSGRALVSSMSIRNDMGGNATARPARSLHPDSRPRDAKHGDRILKTAAEATDHRE